MARPKNLNPCAVDGCPSPVRGRGYCNKHYLRLVRHGAPLKGSTGSGVLLRWLLEVALHHKGEDCLTWPFHTDRHGYGYVRVEGRGKGAHRHLCEVVHGPPPSPMHEAAHSCGRGDAGCVSPHHISWKTPAENQADRFQHGTNLRGEDHPSSKITEADARFIKSMRGKVYQRVLAEKFGVARKTISLIQTGRNWAHLEAEKPSERVA